MKRKTFKAWLVLGTMMDKTVAPILRQADSRADARLMARTWRKFGDKSARARRVLITEIGRA